MRTTQAPTGTAPSAETQTACTAWIGQRQLFLIYLQTHTRTTPIEDCFKSQHASTPTQANQLDKRINRPLRILNINFRSVVGKRAEIVYLLDSMKPDIILGTETWLDPSITDSEYLPDRYNYKVYRRDRNREGGGVLIAVRGTWWLNW